MDSVAPLLARLQEEEAKQSGDLFRVAVLAMPKVMLAVLEEVRGISGVVLLAMRYVMHYHQPKLDGPIAHFTVEQNFTHYEFKAPTPEIVLECRIYVNERNTVRIVLVSSLGLAKLNELKTHLDCDTTFETYIGPYPWEQNAILGKSNIS